MKNFILRFAAFCVCFVMIASVSVNCYRSFVGISIDDRKTDDVSAENIIEHTHDGGIIINTTSLTDTKGFAGKTPLRIFINSDDIIEKIEVLPNSETPAFFENATELFNRWTGKKVSEITPSAADAVSGATFSSNSIKANVAAACSYYMSENQTFGATKGLFSFKFAAALLVTLCAAVCPIFIRNRIYHIVQLVLNVIVLGFWCGYFISYYVMIGYMSFGTDIISAIVVLIMMAVAFIYPIFGRKQHYCSFICPLGSIQQLASMVCPKKIRMSQKRVKALTVFREFLWAVLIFFLWIHVMTEWIDYELFSAFIIRSASLAVLISASVIVIISLFISRPYCRFICPTGTLMKVQENMFNQR